MSPGPGGRHQAEDEQDHQEAVQCPVPPDHVPVMIPGQSGQVRKDPCPHVGKGVVPGSIGRFRPGLFGLCRTLEDVPEVIGEWLDMDVLWRLGPPSRFFPCGPADHFPVGRLVGGAVETGGIDKGLDHDRPAPVMPFPFTGQLAGGH
ncbi:MAG: hypothetical protein OXC82_01785 [Rhodobacteraceae bacterium]|nr:hypothetical protein [Paracoccaceae bacterium]